MLQLTDNPILQTNNGYTLVQKIDRNGTQKSYSMISISMIFIKESIVLTVQNSDRSPNSFSELINQ